MQNVDWVISSSVTRSSTGEFMHIYYATLTDDDDEQFLFIVIFQKNLSNEYDDGVLQLRFLILFAFIAFKLGKLHFSYLFISKIVEKKSFSSWLKHILEQWAFYRNWIFHADNWIIEFSTSIRINDINSGNEFRRQWRWEKRLLAAIQSSKPIEIEWQFACSVSNDTGIVSLLLLLFVSFEKHLTNWMHEKWDVINNDIFTNRYQFFIAMPCHIGVESYTERKCNWYGSHQFCRCFTYAWFRW